jgi:rSAM/selenodomain-associated transferase 1
MAGVETEPHGTRARSLAATPIKKTRPARRSPAADRSSRDITLIVFCREPLAGQAKTRLIPRLGAANAAALARAFIDDALCKCRALGPARIVIAASAPGGAGNSIRLRRIARRFGAALVDQGGGSLGARMARALEPYRAGGAALIGTDTPSLPLELLARSVALLRHAPVVIAPSLDGGYYLVGVRGPMPGIFRAIRWGRKSVLSQTLARLRRSRTRYALGPAWYDVDRISDVALLTAHLARIKTQCRSAGARGHRDTSRPPPLPCPATARVLQRLGLLRAGR